MNFDIEKMLIKSYIGKKEFLYPLIIIKTDNYILDVFLDDDKLEINEQIDRSTGIGNRRGMNKYLEECTKGIYRLYLFDINGLKKVNDIYGHAAGDDMIISKMY